MKKFISLLILNVLLISAPAFAATSSVSRSGGGSASDEAYNSTTWDGVTSTPPSKNAVRDKIEAIVVGDPVWFTDSTTTGNVNYVGCTDDIATAVAAATAGDTLVLGSCTYSVSAQISVDKSLNITGQGPESTVISIGAAAFIPFYVTASDVTIQNLKIEGTENLNAGAINFDGEGGATLEHGVVRNVHVVISNDPGVAAGIKFEDAGGDIDGNYVSLTQTVGASQSYGISAWANQASSSQDADIYVRMTNNISEIIELGTGVGQIRPYMFWISSTYNNQYSIYGTMDNCIGRVKPFSTANAGVEAINIQGPNEAYNAGVAGKLEVFISNSYFDGAWKQQGVTPSTTNWKNMRMDDYSITHLQNVSWNYKANIQNQNSGTIYRDGRVQAYGISGDPAPDQQADHLSGFSVIDLYGQRGGNKPGTGSTTGLIGGKSTITLGDGGEATGATVTGTGGAGGDFNLTSGAGSDQTAATATTNNAGDGGAIKIYGGTGGDASGAATTNNGGDGASLYLNPGDNGTGATTNGVDGNIFLNVDDSASGGLSYGSTFIGTNDIGDQISSGSKLNVSTGMELRRASTTAATSTDIYLGKSRGTIAVPTALQDLDETGSLGFYGHDGNSWEKTAEIVGVVDGTVSDGAMPTGIRFSTGGTTSSTARMFIDSAGLVGIGTSDPLELLHLKHATDPSLLFDRSDTTITTDEVVGQIDFRNNDTQLTTQNLFATIKVISSQSVTTDAAAGDIVFSTTGTSVAGSPTERMRIDADGGVSITSTLTSAATSSIGWSTPTVANQACNTTCTSACVFGQNTGDMSMVGCADATADFCLCAGAS